MGDATVDNTKVIDPDGDIILVIPETQPQNQDEANQKVAKSGSPRQFRVSSKHLTLASSYFKGRLKSNWPEGRELAEKGTAEISLDGPGCDPWALLLILHIFHARGRHVPETVSLKTLLKIALATDYLQCHESVENYGLRWSRNLVPQLPSTFSSNTKSSIMISYTFGWNELFQRTTQLAQQQGKGPLDTAALPIPQSIKGTLSSLTGHIMSLMLQRANR